MIGASKDESGQSSGIPRGPIWVQSQFRSRSERRLLCVGKRCYRIFGGHDLNGPIAFVWRVVALNVQSRVVEDAGTNVRSGRSRSPRVSRSNTRTEVQDEHRCGVRQPSAPVRLRRSR